jgi:hypothetical protein
MIGHAAGISRQEIGERSLSTRALPRSQSTGGAAFAHSSPIRSGLRIGLAAQRRLHGAKAAG